MPRNVPYSPASLYSRRMGISDICSGTTSSATTIANRVPRSGKRIQAKAYAAKAAIVIGMTVEGMVTIRLFRKALIMPSAPSTVA
jgi:hypothetical protein